MEDIIMAKDISPSKEQLASVDHTYCALHLGQQP